MDKNEFNNNPSNSNINIPEQPISPSQPIPPAPIADDNPFKNIQPINMDEIDLNNPISTPTSPQTTTSQPSPEANFNKPSNHGKSKRSAIVAIITVVTIIGIIASLFLTGVIGKHQTTVGDYIIDINEDQWGTVATADDSALMLFSKENPYSAIGLYQYGEEITYDIISQKDVIKNLFNSLGNIKLENQSEQVINNTKCVVTNIKYTTSTNASDKAIKAFCENKDNVIFRLDIEGQNQSDLNSNLETGVKFIRTAKHK